VASPTSSTQGMWSLVQIASSLQANKLARDMEGDRFAAETRSAALRTELRNASNAATAALSDTQRWLQSQRTQRAIKNAEGLFAQGQEAIAALATRRTGTDFDLQIAAARDSGANAARSAVNGVVGDALPVEMTQALATARARASLQQDVAVQQDDLMIRSSRAAASAPVAGDLTTLLPGLDRRFTPPPVARHLPSSWETLLQGVMSLSGDERANLAHSAVPMVQQGTQWVQQQYNDRFTDNALWGMEDR
jgi:hypothetical protein